MVVHGGELVLCECGRAAITISMLELLSGPIAGLDSLGSRYILDLHPHWLTSRLCGVVLSTSLAILHASPPFHILILVTSIYSISTMTIEL